MVTYRRHRRTEISDSDNNDALKQFMKHNLFCLCWTQCKKNFFFFQHCVKLNKSFATFIFRTFQKAQRLNLDIVSNSVAGSLQREHLCSCLNVECCFRWFSCFVAKKAVKANIVNYSKTTTRWIEFDHFNYELQIFLQYRFLATCYICS